MHPAVAEAVKQLQTSYADYQPLMDEYGITPRIVGVTVTVAVMVFTYTLLKFRKASMDRDCQDYKGTPADFLKIMNNKEFETYKDKDVKASVDQYADLFSGVRNDVGKISSEESIQERRDKYQTMITNFYDLVTDFYEYGWGQSFHFGPRWKGESFVESIKRAEYHLCSRLGMKPGMRALDVGCGVGGPMRNMAIFSGAKIDGITINQYQVNIGNKYNQQKGLADLCKLHRGDFQNQPWEDQSFDCAFAVEATCHSPDKVRCFSEVFRCLKPGGMFANYEWIVTDKYDPKNTEHKRIKEGIEVGNGLPTLATAKEVIAAAQKAGFEVTEFYDANQGVHSPSQIPWYDTLTGKMSLSGFRMTRPGRWVTHAFVSVLEFMRIAPRGTAKISAILNATAVDLVDGGKLEIFTPSFFFLARKPLVTK